jgi:hypothetical protein
LLQGFATAENFIALLWENMFVFHPRHQLGGLHCRTKEIPSKFITHYGSFRREGSGILDLNHTNPNLCNWGLASQIFEERVFVFGVKKDQHAVPIPITIK